MASEESQFSLLSAEELVLCELIMGYSFCGVSSLGFLSPTLISVANNKISKKMLLFRRSNLITWS